MNGQTQHGSSGGVRAPSCGLRQKVAVALDLHRDLLRRKCRYPGCRQFQGEWQPFHQVTDTADSSLIFDAEGKFSCARRARAGEIRQRRWISGD